MNISCVMPCYNAERFLREALESVFGQTMPPAEVIVIDDGSTDRSAEVAASFGGRIRYVGEASEGPDAGRNRGIELDREGVIAFIDAGDVVERAMIGMHAARGSAHQCL